MKEKIILAPGANSTELLRTLARHGKNTFGVRIMNSLKLAEYLLMKNGVTEDGTFLSASEKSQVYLDFLRSGICDYFRTVSIADAVNIAAAVDSARKLITENEKEGMSEKLSHGEFPEKNSALFSAYKFYMNYLEKNGCCDDITEIRKAVSSGSCIDAEFVTLKEFPLQPLEKKLIEAASGGSYNELSLCKFAEKKPVSLHVEKYVSAYGASNEVEWITGEILENSIPVDNCTVAIADIPRYSQLFYDLCSVYNIPVTFGCGIPVSNSNPGAVLSLVDKLSGAGFFGIDAYKELLNSPAFDKSKLREKLSGVYYPDNLIKNIGNLRISFDRKSNEEKLLSCEKAGILSEEDFENIRVIADEFGKGPSYIISEYSVIRKGPAAKYDVSALKVITDTIDTYLEQDKSITISDIIPKVLSKQICAESSREGCLYVTGIGSAINTIRENLFVCGMSAASFPGSPKENYLLLDSDCLMFGDKDSVPGSEKAVKDKLNLAKDLVSFASYCGNRIYMSYSSFNLADIKESNPSSVLFDFFAEEKGRGKTVDDFNASLVKTGFFEKNLGIDAGVGREYKSGNIASGKDKEITEGTAAYEGNRTFSPSQIEVFISCPRHFYLSSILGIPEEETDEPFTVIGADDFGTLVHEMMKEKSDEGLTKDEVSTRGREKFDNFLKSRPPIHETDVEGELNEFLECLGNACDMDTGGTAVMAEEKLTVRHPSGITLRGIPDRIEKLNDSYIVIDYKTGRNIRHVDNDPKTCIQTLLYAYMIGEAKNIRASGCEYRYLRSGNVVKCICNDETQDAVDGYLRSLSEAIDKSEFAVNPGDKEENCRYCSFGKICGKNDAEAKE